MPTNAPQNPFMPGTPVSPEIARITQEDYGYRSVSPAAPTAPMNDSSPGASIIGQFSANNSSAAGAPGATPSLTVGSGQFTNAPAPYTVPAVQSLADTYAQVKGMFTPLDASKETAIKDQVNAEFAPRFAEQQRVNDVRDLLFKTGRAQQGDLGFGASDLARGGIVATAQEGANQLARLHDLASAEAAARIQAAQTKNFDQQTSFLTLANQLRQQSLDELQQYRQNMRQSTQDTKADATQQLEYLSQLSPAELAKYGGTSQIEQSLGLPAGYLNSVQATKAAAKAAQTTEDFTKVFNTGAIKAAELPVGQSFTLQSPTGEEITFTGTKPNEYQIVSNKSGIYVVDKLTMKVTKAASFPVSESDTTSDDKDIKAFQKSAADLIPQLDSGKVSWAAAYDSLKAEFPKADPETINAILGGGIPYDKKTNVFDTANAYGRAKTVKK